MRDALAPAGGAAPDCRQPQRIFSAFSAEVRNVTAHEGAVNVTLQLKNASSTPVSVVSVAGNALTSAPIVNLVSPQGQRYPDNGTMIPDLGRIAYQTMAPGSSEDMTLGFDAPPGPYTLTIAAEGGRGGVVVNELDLFRCSLTATEEAASPSPARRTAPGSRRRAPH